MPQIDPKILQQLLAISSGIREDIVVEHISPFTADHIGYLKHDVTRIVPERGPVHVTVREKKLLLCGHPYVSPQTGQSQFNGVCVSGGHAICVNCGPWPCADPECPNTICRVCSDKQLSDGGLYCRAHGGLFGLPKPSDSQESKIVGACIALARERGVLQHPKIAVLLQALASNPNLQLAKIVVQEIEHMSRLRSLPQSKQPSQLIGE